MVNYLRQTVRHLLKTSFAYAAYACGMIDPLASYRTGIRDKHRIIILGYHRVVEDFQASAETSIPSLLISAQTFRKQLELILKGYECLSLDDVADALEGRRTLTRDAVVLTFDDGYVDFYQVAYPILRSYGLPAAIFLPSSFIGRAEPLVHDQIYYLVKEIERRGLPLAKLLAQLGFEEYASTIRAFQGRGKLNCFETMRALFDLPCAQASELTRVLKQAVDPVEFPAEYQPLTWAMVRELAAHGITVGAHTCNHVLLTCESDEVIRNEIRESKERLEAELNRPVSHFAFPDGRYDQRVLQAVREAGFRTACTIEDRPNTLVENPLLLKRKVIWERTYLGLFGNFSEIIAECQLRGLFANPAYKLQSV